MRGRETSLHIVVTTSSSITVTINGTTVKFKVIKDTCDSKLKVTGDQRIDEKPKTLTELVRNKCVGATRLIKSLMSFRNDRVSVVGEISFINEIVEKSNWFLLDGACKENFMALQIRLV